MHQCLFAYTKGDHKQQQSDKFLNTKTVNFHGNYIHFVG